MFPWNIAKTAEAMFSKFAVKRLCKFLLKKKLGQFLLGEIDIDQLDVQLADGTIQLSDLALNVDFLNEKVWFCCFLFVTYYCCFFFLKKMGTLKSVASARECWESLVKLNWALSLVACWLIHS